MSRNDDQEHAMQMAAGQEHIDSYYAATQRDQMPFPALEGDVAADVCIVGGGLTGVASAVEFVERGFDTVLLEANRIGWGASGRNGGQIIGGCGGALAYNEKLNRKLNPDARDQLWKMSLESVEIIRERISKYQIECDLQWGFLDAALKERELEDLRASYEKKRSLGYPHELKLLDAEGVRDYLGTDRYIGGLVNEGWGHCHILDLCKGEARTAENIGARICEQTLVTSIEQGDTARVITETGGVKAKNVVLCGNAYLAGLAPRLVPKLAPYILPATSYIIATERLSDELARDVMPRNYAVCDQRWALDYFRLTPDNRMLFGGLSNYSAKPPRSVSKTLRSKMVKVFPQLADVGIDFCWGGKLGISFRRIPQLGQLGPNIFYSQAYSGHGVAPTHITARLLAEAVEGNRNRFNIISNNWHIPFPGFGFLRQSLYALGMSYFKLRDELG